MLHSPVFENRLIGNICILTTVKHGGRGAIVWGGAALLGYYSEKSFNALNIAEWLASN